MLLLRVTISKRKRADRNELETDKTLINNLLESEKTKEFSGRPLEYFYEDVIEELIKFKFKTALGTLVYQNATDDATTCLETCRFSLLNQYKIHAWLLVALKFIDHFVLHYLQDVKKVSIKKIDNTGVEKSRYIQLIGLKCNASKAGSNLINLINLRSKKLEHRTRITRDGRQQLLKPDRKSIYREVIQYYPEVLKIFLAEYKSHYPDCKTK